MTSQDPAQTPGQESGADKPRPVLLLLQQKQEATKLSFQLRLKGKKEEAEKASAKGEELGRQIDKLINSEMQNWLQRAQTLEGKLEKAVQRLESAVQEIRHDTQVTRNITKAFGLLDDTITAAEEIVGAA